MFSKRMHLVIWGCLIVLSLMLAACNGGAAEYPDKTIKFFVGANAGGGTDILARLLTAEMEKELGESCVVVNKPGAAGQISNLELANSKKDGYTLGFLTDFNTLVAMNTDEDLGYKLDDLEYICSINRSTNAIIIRKDFPGGETFEDFVKYARENPGKVKIGHSAVGQALLINSLEEKAGIKLSPIMYNGGGNNYNALLGGHIDVAIIGTKFSAQAAEKGCTTLAVTSDKRIDILPEIPALQEFGYDVVNNEITRIIVAPKGTPQEAIDKIRDTVKKVTATDAFQKKLSEINEVYEFRSGESLMEIFNKKNDAIKAIVESNPELFKTSN